MASGSITTLGIGSGLDLQNILDQLKTAERLPITKKENKKTALTNEINAYNSVNTMLFSMKSSALSLSLESEFLKNSASISDEEILTASTNNGIESSSHNIEVVQKAQYHSWQTAGVESQDAVIYAAPKNTGIESKDVSAITENGTMNIKYGALEEQDSIDIALDSGMSLTDIVGAINSSNANKDEDGNLKVMASLGINSDEEYYIRVASASGGNRADTQVSVEGDGTDFTIADVTISVGKADAEDPMYLSVAAGTTYEQMAAEINNASDNPGVTASLVNTGTPENPFRLTLTANGTGENNRITVQNLPMDQVTGAPDEEGNPQSLNAIFTVNGVEYQRQENAGITDVISGVTLNLKKVGETSVGIQKDLEPIKEKITSLIDGFNKLISEIKGTNSEDDTETEEEDSPLANSYDVKNMISRLQSLITTSIITDSEYISLVDLGLEVNKDGTMALNEVKLEQAIESNPEAVQSLFIGDEEAGISGLGDIINDGINKMVSSQGTVATKIDAAQVQMDRLDTDIQKAIVHLDKQYDIMARQFSQLDSQISSLNSQAAYMTSMFESFNKTND